nr:N-acetylneuraminate synthase family protein [uncultured Holophaga sp.]
MSAFPKPLIIFEMANNHMGQVEHGLRILDTFAKAVQPFRKHFDFGFKLQYRHLDTFIHPQAQGRMDIKYVKRFEETRLSEPQFRRLREGMRDTGFQAICTPFDETSVDMVEAHGFDFLKIASCSLGDWPLMERMARSPLPVIASTAGSGFEVLDRVVSFFEHREHPLSIMHCVAEYPTPAAHLNLNQINLLQSRYPSHPIGFSTHEEPANTRFVQMALAKGVQLLEKHVGLPTPEWPLNNYSSNPEETVQWLSAASEALEALGERQERYAASQAELESLHALRRGVFVTEPVEAGQPIDPAKVLLAIPTVPGQLTANDLSKYAEFIAQEPIPALGPVMGAAVKRMDNRERVYAIVLQVRELLKASHTVVGNQAEVEISHHYGLERFEQFGATIINLVNRAYCKKLIVMLPGQRHPEQFHKEKEETFHILHGSVDMILDDECRTLKAGDILTVERGVRHDFSSAEGSVIEEISSTHIKSDSYYTDESILRNPNRKTHLTYFFG